MWAAYIALVNQQLASNGSSTIGFINPTIYAQNVTSSYGTDFHDITSGTSGSYSAVTGFDLVTGWGSPNAGLIAALTGAPQTPGFSLSASPTFRYGGAGRQWEQHHYGHAERRVQFVGGLTASGQPTGVTISFNPSTVTGGSGTSTMGISVASTTTPGTYPITVTGTSGSTVETTTVSLTVTGTTPGFSISASPTTISIARSSSGTVTISTAVSGGFNSAIALSASGAGKSTIPSVSRRLRLPGREVPP